MVLTWPKALTIIASTWRFSWGVVAKIKPHRLSIVFIARKLKVVEKTFFICSTRTDFFVRWRKRCSFVHQELTFFSLNIKQILSTCIHVQGNYYQEVDIEYTFIDWFAIILIFRNIFSIPGLRKLSWLYIVQAWYIKHVPHLLVQMLLILSAAAFEKACSNLAFWNSII